MRMERGPTHSQFKIRAPQCQHPRTRTMQRKQRMSNHRTKPMPSKNQTVLSSQLAAHPSQLPTLPQVMKLRSPTLKTRQSASTFRRWLTSHPMAEISLLCRFLIGIGVGPEAAMTSSFPFRTEHHLLNSRIAPSARSIRYRSKKLTHPLTTRKLHFGSRSTTKSSRALRLPSFLCMASRPMR